VGAGGRTLRREHATFSHANFHSRAPLKRSFASLLALVTSFGSQAVLHSEAKTGSFQPPSTLKILSLIHRS